MSKLLKNSLICLLKQKIFLLKKTIVSLNEKLSGANGKSLHSMEVEQEDLVQSASMRRAEMSDTDLRQDLEKQYGRSGWAKKLIDGMMKVRVLARK